MTLNDISVRLRVLGYEIGGNHVTPEEAQETLQSLAEEIDKQNMTIAFETTRYQSKVSECTGITDTDIYFYLKNRDFEERNPKKESAE